jgi:two-component system cell cycle sensor histidine kinase/response regulator CckA
MSSLDLDAYRVLVVDDEECVRMFAERALQAAGYEVVVAPNGPAALRLVDTAVRFDLFVLDVQMPQMRGDELARELRQRNLDVKVLFCTGDSEQLLAERRVLSQNEAFVEKPVSLKALRDAVSLLLFGHSNGPDAGGVLLEQGLST